MITHTAHAPGRVELLGNHTDYNDGFVLSAAIDRGVTVEGFATGTRDITIHAETFSRSLTVPVSKIERQTEESWANYPLGVVKLLVERGYPISGFSARIGSSLPAGAGLSSSAALEVATGKFLEKTFGFSLTPLDLAKICKEAENKFVGVNCGLLDQVSSIFGKDGHAVALDCRNETIENIPFPRGAALMICHSGVKHRLVGGEYNERREQCFSAAAKLGVAALRDVTLEQLEAGRGKLTDLEYRRALHIVGENTRVLTADRLLRNGDAAGFGKLMFDSHESSRVNFENSIPELDAIVAISKTLPGVFGCRLSGGGFGGATVSLLDESVFETVAEILEKQYQEKTGIECQIYHCLPSAGAE